MEAALQELEQKLLAEIANLNMRVANLEDHNKMMLIFNHDKPSAE